MKKWMSVLFIGISIYSCTKQPQKNYLFTKDDSNGMAKVSTLTPTGTCGSSVNYSGSYTAPSSPDNPELHVYPLQPLSINCPVGSLITMYVSPIDVPNLFEVVDQNINVIARSGISNNSYWVGSNCIGANPPTLPCFGGPWGAPPAVPYNGGQTSFTFIVAAGKSYFLRVSGYIPVSAYQHRTDAWTASFVCTCSGTIKDSASLNLCSCGRSYSGNYAAGSGQNTIQHTYPPLLLNFASCDTALKTVLVSVNPLDLLNKFVIVDQNNFVIARSGISNNSYWVGNNCIGANPPTLPCFGGPWGVAPASPYNGGQTSFSFPLVRSKSYTLLVDGYIPSDVYQHREDFWNVGFSCTK